MKLPIYLALALPLSAAAPLEAAPALQLGSGGGSASGSHGGCRTWGRAATAANTPPAGKSGPAAAESGDDLFTPTFDASLSPAEVLVVYQAIGDWRAAILQGAGFVSAGYTILFVKAVLPPGQVGETSTIWNSTSGVLLSSTITFDSSTSFFVDDSPWEDSEFTGGTCTSGACAAFDLLTVARHHIGHALGWTGHFEPNLNPWIANFMPANNGTLFDPTRWRIPLDSALTSHVDTSVWPKDLMTPSLPTSQRRGISLYPDATLIARGFNYLEVAMHYVGDAPGGSLGNPWYPYFSFAEANQLAPSGVSILARSQNYSLYSERLVLDVPHVYTVVHGGTAVIR